jgi:hypothetical protein
MKPLLLIGLLACSASTFAAQKVLLETPVKVNADAGVAEAVSQECEVGDMLARRVGPALNAVNKPRGKQRKEKDKDRGKEKNPASQDTKAEPAPAVLRLVVVQVQGAGAAEDPSSKEPKSITATAEILEKGKAVRKTRITRSHSGGMLSRFKSTCSILNGAATAMAKEIGLWAGDPSHQVAEESAVKGKNKGKAIENTIPANGAR